jgi:Uma2 family endonuclease
MNAVFDDPVRVEEFETVARIAERETEDWRFELIGGRLGVKLMPDGDHGRILKWLLLLLMPLSPGLLLDITGQGLALGKYRKGRARPDGILAPIDAFVGAGEWASANGVVMTVEVTSSDSDTNQRDRVDKPAAYAQTGIPIYLLIDREKTVLVVHTNPDGDRYRDVHTAAFGDIVTLPAPVGITLDTTPLLDWIE